MATFAELLADIYTITKRPDLVDRTKLAIRQATLKLHQRDFYPKDIAEFGVSFTTEQIVQSFEYKLVQPRWRQAKYFRRTTVDGASDLPFFDILTPEETLDDYGVNRVNICYLAGSVYQFRCAVPFQYMFVGAYLNPDITEASFSSWIAEEHPFAIVHLAAAMIFRSIGNDEEYKSSMNDAAIEQANITEEVVGKGE